MAKNNTQQTEEIGKVPRITQEIAYQADFEIHCTDQNIKKTDGHEPNDNKQNLQREREHNSQQQQKNTEGINQPRSWEICTKTTNAPNKKRNQYKATQN